MRRFFTVLTILTLVSLFIAGCASAPETEPSEEPTQAETAQSEPEPAAEPEIEEEPETDATAEVAPEPEAEAPRPMNETLGAVTLRAGNGSYSPVNTAEQPFFIDGAAGQPIQSWSFTVTDASGNAIHEERGTGAPPERLGWDGTRDGGSVEEGEYTSALSIVYDDGSTRTVETNPFLVDLTAPIPSLRLRNTPFTPDGDGNRDELIITIEAEDASPIEAWLFEIQTLDGRTLATFSDESDVPRTARWNGRPGGGFVVESGDEYRIVGGVRDDAGNEGVTETTFIIGALTESYRGRSRIVLPSIQFPANSARLSDATPAARERFENVVDRLARILRESGDTRVLIEGHANATRFSGSRPDPAEQRNELVPLSRDRAAVVRDALIERGIAADRLEIDGVGAADPVASFSNASQRDRNRRIAFYVID